MSIAKDQIKQVLDSQPDDSSYDEILKELAFKRMIDKGLLDVKAENTISNQEMKHRIKSWQKYLNGNKLLVRLFQQML